MSNASGPARQVVLVVLDGWGYRPEREGNAIELARTPVWHRLWNSEPRTLLDASGLAVGLPEGQMGNSEVGHLNLGAGRVVPQDLVRISGSIRTGEFFRLEPLVELCARLRDTGGTLQLLGLLGAGGVHAIDTHLLAAVELGIRERVPRIAVHGFLDGRDSAPTSAADVVARLQADLTRLAGPRAVIASLTGRYFAMDRDRRWDRTRLAYDVMVHGVGRAVTDPVQAVRDAYARGETDEFVKPLILTQDGAPVAPIRSGDGVFCFNYRSDRMRQICRALAMHGFDGFDTGDAPHAGRAGHHDAVRPDLSLRAGLSAVLDGAHRVGSAGGRGAHAAAHRRNREVPARDLLLQRRGRDAVSRRGADPRPVAKGGHLRPGAGHERRRALPTCSAARSRSRRTTSSCATMPTPTWWGTPA